MTAPARRVTAEERHQASQALYAYCRGLDRFDRELALSAFAPGATLDYGGVYAGDAPGFMDWVWPFHEQLELNIHRIANVFIERNRSGELISESYVVSTLRRREDGEFIDRSGYGRYIDRWTRTPSGAAIIEREYINDLVTEQRNPESPTRVVSPVDRVISLEARRDAGDGSYRLFTSTIRTRQ